MTATAILSPDDDGREALIAEAARFVGGLREVGPAQVQRKLRVGFAKAALLLEALEERGVVGRVKADGRRDVLPSWAVGDRVLITAPDHPWHGHTGTITGPFESVSVPELKWTVAIDGAWVDAAVTGNDIRRADS